MPRHVVEELKREHDQILTKLNKGKNDVDEVAIQQKIYFQKFDQLLDSSSHGALWLENNAVAQQVVDAIHFHDKKTYELISYTIMPNHVHLLIDQPANLLQVPLYKVLQSIKKYSARKSNKILERVEKAFWQNESYDHIVRDEQELENIIRYIIYNPVKAGLCSSWQEWKRTWLKDDYKKLFR